MRNRSSIFFLLVILTFAAFLRFYRIKELATFRGDQAIELSATAKITQGKFTLIGIKTSNSEVRNGAVMYYIMAPFLYLFGYDPVAGGVVQSLLSLLAIVIIFFIGKKFRSVNVGLFAAFIASTSALLVRYSRQNLLAFFPLAFVSFTFYILATLLKNFSPKLVFILGVTLGFMLQVHYSTLAVVLACIVAPFIFFPRNYWLKYYIFILLGFVVGFLPMILFELRHEFLNTKSFLSFIEKSQQNTPNIAFSQLVFWQDAIAKLFFGGSAFLANIFFILLSTTLLKLRNKFNTLEKLCIFQISSTVLFTLFFVRENVVHYAISAFPALILLCSCLLDGVRNIFGKNRFEYILTTLAIFFLTVNFTSYGLSDKSGWTMAPGWDLVGVEKAARIIADDVNGLKYNVVMLIDGESQGLPLRYFLEIWGKQPLSTVDYDKVDLLYVAAQPEIDLTKIKLWEIDSFGAYTVSKVWEIQNGFLLYRLGKRTV